VYFRSTGRPFLDIKGGVNDYKTLRFSEGADGTHLWDVNIDPTTNNMGFYSGAEMVTFTYDGRVGVGTTDPQYTLDVSGSGQPVIVARSSSNSPDKIGVLLGY
jgi:hypothetical protein